MFSLARLLRLENLNNLQYFNFSTNTGMSPPASTAQHRRIQVEALHSLDDKLGRENKHRMLDIPECVALKAVRNHFHHAEEVRNGMRIKSRPCKTAAPRMNAHFTA